MLMITYKLQVRLFGLFVDAVRGRFSTPARPGAGRGKYLTPTTPVAPSYNDDLSLGTSRQPAIICCDGCPIASLYFSQIGQPLERALEGANVAPLHQRVTVLWDGGLGQVTLRRRSAAQPPDKLDAPVLRASAISLVGGGRRKRSHALG